VTERTFPVLADWSERRRIPNLPLSVPWEFIEPGRAQAQDNHDQTLERLAQRGGLCAGEMRCALEGKRLFPYFDDYTDERGAQDAQWLIERLAAPRTGEKP